MLQVKSVASLNAVARQYARASFLNNVDANPSVFLRSLTKHPEMVLKELVDGRLLADLVELFIEKHLQDALVAAVALPYGNRAARQYIFEACGAIH